MPAEFAAGFRYATTNTELVLSDMETSQSAKKDSSPKARVAVSMAPNISLRHSHAYEREQAV